LSADSDACLSASGNGRLTDTELTPRCRASTRRLRRRDWSEDGPVRYGLLGQAKPGRRHHGPPGARVFQRATGGGGNGRTGRKWDRVRPGDEVFDPGSLRNGSCLGLGPRGEHRRQADWQRRCGERTGGPARLQRQVGDRGLVASSASRGGKLPWHGSDPRQNPARRRGRGDARPEDSRSQMKNCSNGNTATIGDVDYMNGGGG
jgi:hypothetical protein